MEQNELYLIGGGIIVAIMLLIFLFASPQIEEVDYSYRDKPVDLQPVQPVSDATGSSGGGGGHSVGNITATSTDNVLDSLGPILIFPFLLVAITIPLIMVGGLSRW